MAMWWWLASTSYELERPLRNVKYRARVKRNNLTIVRNNNNTVSGAGSKKSTVSGRTSCTAAVESPGKVCRVCLKDAEVPIYGTGTDLCEAVKLFGDIQIDKADKFPKYLCGMCHSMLQSAILFRKQAKETELILQEKIKSNKAESSEPVAKKSRLEGHLGVRSAPKSYNIIPKGSAPVADCEEKIDSEKITPKPICHKVESEFEVKKQCIVVPQSSPDTHEVHLEETEGAKSCTSDYTSQKSTAQHKKSTQNSSHCRILKKTKFSSSFEQHSSKSNICEICGKTFSTNYGLYKHVLLHSSKLPFHCEFRPYRGNTVENYEIHLGTHTKEKPYVCDECGLGYTTKSNLTEHRLRHMGKQFKCNKCQKSYYTKRQLERHVRCVVDWCPDGPEGFACEMCGKKFKNKLVLRIHELRFHKVKTSRSLQQHTSESKICDICGKTFSSKYTLSKHIMLHSSELPFHCEFCPYRGNTVENYKIHLRSHTKEKPYVCDECGLGCITKSNLIKHRLRHKEKQFKCTKCQKRYYTKWELERHVRCVVHRCLDGPEEFECGMCGNKFENKKVLRTHERIVHKYKRRKPGRKPLYLENASKP